MTDSLTTLSPLMQPVFWQEHEYFTSQYFHQKYIQQKAEEGEPGKLQRHDNFRRKIHNIESYARLLAGAHIVELPWEAVKTGPTHILSRLKPLFESTGYYPLLLLDATAQIELTHHLDDELSKEIAYRHSHNATTPRKPGASLPEETAIRIAEAYGQLGQFFGIPEHIIQQEAVKQIEVRTGVNLRAMLLAAPAQKNIAPEDMMLEPTELAVRFGLPSAYVLNRHLEVIGWQVKRIGGGWEPTPNGAPHATTHAWTSAHGTKSGYNLLWKCEAVRQLFITHGVLPEPQPQLPLLDEGAPHA
jgi:hypothetical protein